jgi:alpha-L-rhamnosidase
VTATQPTRLRIEHDADGLGIGRRRPRLSWWLPADARQQIGYRIEMHLDDAAADVAEVEAQRSILCPWPFEDLNARNRVRWRVQVLTDRGWSDWSSFHQFEVGLLDRSNWAASFIGMSGDGRTTGPRGQRPALYFRTTFRVDGSVTRARLRATALGLYEFHLDGQRVGDRELTPGFTAYRSTLEHQTYDVTELLGSGDHEMIATLSDGWYRGSVGFTREEFSFGEQLALLAQLEIDLDDGRTILVGTDATWSATAHGPIIAADLIEGQRADLRMPFPPTDEWQAAQIVEVPAQVRIATSQAPPTRVVQRLRPSNIVRLDAERQVVSFPANINGWLHVAPGALGEAGNTVTFTHGEALTADGDVNMEILEVNDFMTGAPLGHGQVDVAVSNGMNGASFEPRHTTHGFQHVRVEGAPDLDASDLEACLVHTDMTRTGWFRCSDARLERLHEAAVLSFVGNACEIPTDCPQRERAGWTGDWQIFAPTASFLYDVAGFTDRWLRDLASDQWPDGRVTNHVPDPVGPAARHHPVADHMTGSSGWGDAATIVPVTAWQSYGDLELLERQYPSMVAWVEFALRTAAERRHPSRIEQRPDPSPHETYLWDTGFHWGEWSEPGTDHMDVLTGRVEQGHVATAYLARSLDALTLTARLLDDSDAGHRWAELAAKVRNAWHTEYLAPDGRVEPHTQANLCRALAFDLVPQSSRGRVIDDLVALVAADDFHVRTGFLTTPFLLPTLTDCGRGDVAFRLLMQTTVPSWLAMIEAGATTIWENWLPEESASLNHYSKGAVVTFLHQYVAGIRPIPGHAAYERFEIRPTLGGGLTWAEADLDTPYGRISSAWRLGDETFDLDVTVPPSTRATIHLPDDQRYDMGPGRHRFTCPTGPRR